MEIDKLPESCPNCGSKDLQITTSTIECFRCEATIMDYSHALVPQPRKLTVEQVARVCHEANRVLQSIFGDDVSPEWNRCRDWLKSSTMDGVRQARTGAWPRELHEKWCEYKRKEGWVYGEKKDPVAKTHPCLLPYEELPADQRLKDDVFVAIVRVLS